MAMINSAQALFKALTRAKAALEKGDTEGAVEAVQTAKPALDDFVDAARDAQTRSGDVLTHLKDRANNLSDTIEAATKELKRLQSNLTALKSALHRDQDKVDQKRLLTKERMLELDKIYRDLAAHKEKLDRLKKWCWVPGYGAYLAIDALVQDDIGALKTASLRLRQTKSDAQRLAHELGAISSHLNSVRAAFNQSSNAKDNVQGLLDRANRDLAIAQARTSYMARFLAAVSDLKQTAEHLELRDLERLQEVLDRVLSLDLDDDAHLVIRRRSKFEEGLMAFAMSLDSQIDFLVFNPTPGTTVNIANAAAYVASCRVVKLGDYSMKGRETPNLAVFQHASLPLDADSFEAGDIVQLEMDVAIGPTKRSAPILVVENRGAVPIEARMRGTVFNASIDLEL